MSIIKTNPNTKPLTTRSVILRVDLKCYPIDNKWSYIAYFHLIGDNIDYSFKRTLVNKNEVIYNNHDNTTRQYAQGNIERINDYLKRMIKIIIDIFKNKAKALVQMQCEKNKTLLKLYDLSILNKDVTRVNVMAFKNNKPIGNINGN